MGDFRLKADSPAIDKGPTGEWVDVTNNVGGEKSGAYGVTCMKAVPGSEAVIAGVSECGLWLTNDGGAAWKKLGGHEIKNRPGRIVFDPKDSSIFWVSGCYGDAPFKTEDGGKTFKRLGKLAHADGVAVDFSDRRRKTLLLGLHEQSQSLQLSTDGGQSWKKSATVAPRQQSQYRSGHHRLQNVSGQHSRLEAEGDAGNLSHRNAGETWTSVSTFGPAGEPLIASDGAIYWQRLWGGGLLKSTDRGKTWSAISNAIKSNPIELPGKRLAGLAGNQIMASSDDGVTWTKLGPPAPFRPNGLTYSEKGKCFYAWQLADNLKKPAQSIVRLNIE